MAKENLLSFRDNYLGGRFRKATSDLYFGLEHTAKALLITIGVYPETHKGVSRMLSYHFVRSGTIPLQVVIHLDNLYERRKTSESGWEFTKEQIDTYIEWVKSSVRVIIEELKKTVDHESLKDIENLITQL